MFAGMDMYRVITTMIYIKVTLCKERFATFYTLHVQCNKPLSVFNVICQNDTKTYPFYVYLIICHY